MEPVTADENSKDDVKARGECVRAESLTAEKRASIDSAAARARWSKPESSGAAPIVEAELIEEEIEPDPTMPVARWRGALNIIGMEVPSYVLDNGDRVIGRVSPTEVLSGIKGGGGLEIYLSAKALEPFVNKDLVLEGFVPFRLPEVEGLKKAMKGLPAALSIEVCQGFVVVLQSSFDPKSPHQKMTDRQRQIAIQASMFLSACAKVGELVRIAGVLGRADQRLRSSGAGEIGGSTKRLSRASVVAAAWAASSVGSVSRTISLPSSLTRTTCQTARTM